MATKLSRKLQKDFGDLLLKEAKKLQEQIIKLKSDDPFSDPDHASDNAAVDTDVREQVGHETIAAEIRDLERRLLDIDLALKKIGKGFYGACEKCGQEIPMPRLKILPEARYCVDDEQKLRK